MKKHVALVIVTALTIGMVAGTTGYAREEGGQLTVTSQKQNIDYANRLLTYQGEVRATWENYVIEADKVEVYLTSQETLEKIVATGGVKMTRDTEIQGTCQKASYLPQKEVLTLEGNVKYQDEMGNTLEAQMVTVWTEEKRLQAEGNPVKATYILKEGESGTTSGESK